MKILTGVTGVIAVFAIMTAYVSNSLPSALLGALMIGLALLFGFFEDRAKRAENRRKPIIAVEAKVVSHHKVRERVSRNHSVERYYITFKTEDDQVVEFQVSEIDYEDFDLGETGPLRYRGWEFLSFGVKDKSHIKPMAPLPEEYEPAPEPESALEKLRSRLNSLRTKQSSGKLQSDATPEVEKDNGVLTHELDE